MNSTEESIIALEQQNARQLVVLQHCRESLSTHLFMLPREKATELLEAIDDVTTAARTVKGPKK